jgi:uncharacterized protein
MRSPVTHLVYLHGFRSSPASFKAVRMHQWLQQHRPEVAWWCPTLPPSPRQALQQVEHGIAAWRGVEWAVIGSSLGGFYATCLAERHGCRAVLLNPAVHPARDLSAHVGLHPNYHDPSQQLSFTADHVAELRELERGFDAPSMPLRYFPVIAKGDELLDWREMSGRYASSPMRLIEGSDHGLSDFDEHLPAILQFLQLLP